MNRLFSGLLAGWGATKSGLGCFGTIVVFLLLYFFLRRC